MVLKIKADDVMKYFCFIILIFTATATTVMYTFKKN